jgi:hypothetical protein
MKSRINVLALGTISSALLLSGLATSPVNAAPGDQAVITVSKSTGLNPDGETITITGSGFVPNANLTNATRPPLAPGFGGVYVSFGKFQDFWRPSASAPSANRLLTFADATRTKWLVPAANVAQIGGEAAGGIALASDGTFSVTLNVSKALSASGTLIFDESTIGNYGIYTQTGGGARYAPFETFTPLTFAVPVVVAPTPTPTPTVTPTPAPVVTVKPKLKKTFTTNFRFDSGSRNVATTVKSNIKKKKADYKLASKVTITGEAGAMVGVSSTAVTNLAKKRANAVKKLLVEQGVSTGKIVIKTKVTNPGTKPVTKIVATP